MSEFYSRLDLFNIGRTFVVTRATKINPSEVDVEGSDINLFVGATSYMAYACVQQLQDRLQAFLLDGAEDEDLDRLLNDRYRLPRKGATAAITKVQGWRASAAAGSGSIPVGTVIRSRVDGTSYITMEPMNFGASSLTSPDVLVRATQAGKPYQVGANTLRVWDKPQTLFDSSIQVNNTEASVGGEPAETNDVYRERGRLFFTAARRGILAAIEFGALQTDGVVSAQAVEILTENGEPGRLVELFIADSSGMANTALADRVRETLLEYRAAGIHVIINTSRPVIVPIALRLAFVTGVATQQLSQQVRNAVIAFVNSLGVNRPLLRNELGSVLSRFRESGLIAGEGSIVEPTGDVYPDQGNTIRTGSEFVTLV